jgi:hypothetical protein
MPVLGWPYVFDTTGETTTTLAAVGDLAF